MTTYLFRSILCLAVFLLVYLLFLEKEKMHRFNRWYLLGGIVFACIIPLVNFTIPAESLPVLQDEYFQIIVSGDRQADQTIQIPKNATDYLTPSLWIIYLLGSLFMLMRFARNFYRVLSSAQKNRSVMYQGAKLVLLKERTPSYSFLNNIFITERDYTNHSIEAELLTHELTHVKEKHSWDVIFIESLQVVFWFNPLFLFYKKAIQRNHEYLADDAVIKTYGNIPVYQHLLLDKISPGYINYLTSHFNYLSTKKRLVMMTRTTNHTRALLKKLAVLPILAGALFIFSSKTILAQDKPKPSHRGPMDVPATQDGLTTQEKDEYNRIVKSYVYTNEKGIEAVKNGAITATDRERLTTLFKKMNRSQQEQARVAFMNKIPPYPKKIATEEQFEKWKDPAQYGVWLNGYKIRNEELNKYKRTDLVYFDASKMVYTEAQKKYIMKRYNLDVLYKIKLMVMTMDQYEKHTALSLNAPEYTMFFRTGEPSRPGKRFSSNLIID